MPNDEQWRINTLTHNLSKFSELMAETRDVAFELAKEGNREMLFQIRGAASGIAESARMTECFLAGLRDILD